MRRMATVLPDLWTDWCSVAGVSEHQLDDQTLWLFSDQAGPPRWMLYKLRGTIAGNPAPVPARPRIQRRLRAWKSFH